MVQHCVIYISSKVDKDFLIQQLLKGKLHGHFASLPSLKGEVFSRQTQQAFIEDELKHDHYAINPNQQRSLVTFSDGEQKEALLAYLILQKPSSIILDNIFDNLDIASQENLKKSLTELSQTTTIIQLATRQHDALSFMQTFFVYDGNKIMPFESSESVQHSIGLISTIPSALKQEKTVQNPLIKLTNVSVSYEERQILNKINWQVNAGEFWQLIGPNGSGKSTMLSMIIGDNPKAFNQDLVLFGKKKGTGETVWEIKAKIGYVNSLMTHLFARRDSVESMVIGGFNDSVGLYNKPSEMQVKLADEWLQLIGLYEVKHKAFVDLPAGQQRLVMIARAMVKHPPLLILDEPTVGLDDYDATLFVALVNRIATETSTAIIYVSHRKENGLKPGFLYELTAGTNGSTGTIKQH